jgi:hypothetical protein
VTSTLAASMLACQAAAA